MDGLIERHLHEISAEEATHLLETDARKGLDSFEIEVRRERCGPNRIPERKTRGPLIRFLPQFHQPLVYILLAAGGVTAALGEWVDSGVILGVVLINAVIGFLQESRAEEALSALVRTTETVARVARGGRTAEIPSTELVPGDIVLLQSGDKTPAELRLIRARDPQAGESALTGEPVPVEKSTEPLPADTPLAERVNLAFTSSLITRGQAAGVVFATGGSTEVGRISEMISTADVLDTPLTTKIKRFSRLLVYAIVALAALTFAAGLMRGEAPFDMFMAAVALAAATIPEGLPAAVTITLAIGVRRMARRRAIIRRLPAVEILGSTTTICSDKTGTLIVNQMTVSEIRAGGARYDVPGGGYEPSGEISASEGPGLTENEAARRCLLAGLLCNDSSVEEKDGRWSVQGDPTEAALIVAARKAGLHPEEAGRRRPRLDSIPFESLHQYMATLHAEPKESERTIYVKGSAEFILANCRNALSAGGEITEFDARAVERMARRGLRVLAFATAPAEADADSLAREDVRDLVFLGPQGMIDPPRPEAIAAVRACKTAGVRVKMITGDHAATAAAIAEQIGLNEGGEQVDGRPKALGSRDIDEISDEELTRTVRRANVFARVTPEQKLRLVRALRAGGEVVAMTGDGVNDAPALKQADIVLTNDNFATIEAAVEEGRGVFDNLSKFIVWTLPTNIGEGSVILAAILTGAALPTLPVRILWVNMTTALRLGMTLAFEVKEPDIMRRPPRAPDEPILTRTLLLRIGLVSLIMLVGAFASFEWALSQGVGEAAARTVAVNVFVFVEAFYLLNCRSLTKSMVDVGVFSNRLLLVGFFSAIALQMVFTYSPFMNRLMHSAPISWEAWRRILGTAAAVYAVVSFEKWPRRRSATRKIF